jgi:ankyrin repeat protein
VTYIQLTCRGCAPFIEACNRGHDSICSLLIGSGAEINRGIDNGWTPLVSACNAGNISVVELLVHKGVHFKLTNKAGQAALEIVCLRGRCDIVKLLTSNVDGNKSQYNYCYRYEDAKMYVFLVHIQLRLIEYIFSFLTTKSVVLKYRLYCICNCQNVYIPDTVMSSSD